VIWPLLELVVFSVGTAIGILTSQAQGSRESANFF
jgi:hypothetical protein